MKSSTLKKLVVGSGGVFLLFLLISCATVGLGSSAKTEKSKPPSWVYSPPESDDTYAYFTGAGTSKTGDLAEAESTARNAIIDEILRYIGVEVTSKTTAVAKGSLDSFKASITEKLTSKSSGRITSLEISDRWIDKRGKGVTVYLLARYNRAELEKEKKRLQRLFEERVEAISRPEKEGKALVAKGEYFAGVIKFIEASLAAGNSNVDNARVKFERNINNAKAALSMINLIKLNDNLKGYVGKPFNEPFMLKVVKGTTKNSKGISGVSIRVSYYVLSKTGRKRVKSVTLKTDKNGIVAFKYPIPDFVGKSTVTMSLDLYSYLNQLDNLPPKFRNYVDGLEELVLKKRVVFYFETSSYARVVPMGVVVADTDASGKPIEQNETEDGMLSVFGNARFNIKDIDVDKWSVTALPDRKLIPLLKKKAGDRVKRVVYGFAKISGYEREKDVTVVKVSGTVKVVDLEKGEILLTVSKNKSAIGSKVSTALSTAFRKLGEDLAREIVDKLR